MIDYHIHPDYSFDAEGSVDDFCKSAVREGIHEIAFTTHLDADRQGTDHFVRVKGKSIDVKDGKWLEDYESTIRTAGDQYVADGLTVRLGVEVDCYEGVEMDLPERFHSTDFDYILGSVHMIDHVAISAGDRASAIFEKYDLEEVGNAYFGTLLDSFELDLFDVIAHLDLYRRFGESYYGKAITRLWEPYIEEISNQMKKRNIGFEMNTSPLRRRRLEPMPSKSLAAALFDYGISAITVGSDAHVPADVGAGVSEALAMLQDVGFDDITTFDRRRPSPRSISDFL
jgi:histidinol-phosphatase (PHP family)